MGYHPERAQEEIKHFREIVSDAQTAVRKLVQDGRQRLDQFGEKLHRESGPVDLQTEKQRRADALTRAEKLVADVAK
jgi:hypothetical protein